MPDYTEGSPAPGKSAQVDAVAHAAAKALMTTGQGPGPSAVGDTNHDPNEVPQGNPGRQGSAE